MKNNSASPAITIRQVADKAGVSTATVSRVLNESSLVSDDVKQHVRQVIQDMGYRPNRAARHLRAGHVRRIGVLFADIRNPFFTSILVGIESVLQKAEYCLVLGNSNENPKVEQMHIDSFLEEGVAGIIFAAATNNPANYQAILQAGIPLLAIDRVPDGLRVDSVCVNNVDAANQATAHLISLGHTRIAFIGGPAHIPTARDRLQGYQAALQKAGIAQSIVVHADFQQSGGFEAMKSLLNGPERPTAVLVANNLMTLGALQAIHEANLAIPGDVAIVGFDDMPWATSLQPPLTVVAQPTYDYGVIAARLLLNRIQSPEHPVQKVTLETQLVVRRSCGALAGQSLPTSVD